MSSMYTPTADWPLTIEMFDDADVPSAVVFNTPSEAALDRTQWLYDRERNQSIDLALHFAPPLLSSTTGRIETPTVVGLPVLGGRVLVWSSQSDHEFYRTSDGVTWTLVDSPVAHVMGLGVNSAARILTVSRNDEVAYRSDNGGSSWTTAGTVFDAEPTNTIIDCVGWLPFSAHWVVFANMDPSATRRAAHSTDADGGAWTNMTLPSEWDGKTTRAVAGNHASNEAIAISTGSDGIVLTSAGSVWNAYTPFAGETYVHVEHHAQRGWFLISQAGVYTGPDLGSLSLVHSFPGGSALAAKVIGEFLYVTSSTVADMGAGVIGNVHIAHLDDLTTWYTNMHARETIIAVGAWAHIVEMHGRPVLLTPNGALDELYMSLGVRRYGA